MPSADNCTLDAGVDWLKEKYPDSRIIGDYRGSGYCVFVDGALAIKQSKFASNGYKLCNEFADKWEIENA
jgi:hypothetical protein